MTSACGTLAKPGYVVHLLFSNASNAILQSACRSDNAYESLRERREEGRFIAFTPPPARPPAAQARTPSPLLILILLLVQVFVVLQASVV
ncbi:unnamed protein product [Nippostrongylus brasiliensis]|uniref:Uncharacterized protein n=1 Tax=Nippostrongylus brasiliensis TaxID=27835 RepID=A0A0N4Y8N2_NIPBR|nr:unnamed protein product [Nippostrongylus brasiliensis]